MNIHEFVSNFELKNEISESMLNRTLPHAVIIEGAKGTGKRTLAGILARYAVCTSDSVRPCGLCNSCRKAIAGIHPDIFSTDGNSSGGLAISVIRQIRSDAYIKPNEAPSRVFMLLNCDKMLQPAQNAFLKVLEEPPENVMFILTVTSANMLLETVRSRSRIYSLYPAEIDEAAAYLQTLFPDKPFDEIYKAASKSGGNIGQASYLISSGGEESRQLAEKIMRSVVSGTEYDLLLLTNEITKDRIFAAAVLDNMLEISSECMRSSLGLKTDSDAASEITSKMTKKRLLAITEVISKACGIAATNVNLAFFSTWLCAQLKHTNC